MLINCKTLVRLLVQICSSRNIETITSDYAMRRIRHTGFTRYRQPLQRRWKQPSAMPWSRLEALPQRRVQQSAAAGRCGCVKPSFNATAGARSGMNIFFNRCTDDLDEIRLAHLETSGWGTRRSFDRAACGGEDEAERGEGDSQRGQNHPYFSPWPLIWSWVDLLYILVSHTSPRTWKSVTLWLGYIRNMNLLAGGHFCVAGIAKSGDLPAAPGDSGSPSQARGRGRVQSYKACGTAVPNSIIQLRVGRE